jgi:hypothetical protein
VTGGSPYRDKKVVGVAGRFRARRWQHASTFTTAQSRAGAHYSRHALYCEAETSKIIEDLRGRGDAEISKKDTLCITKMRSGLLCVFFVLVVRGLGSPKTPLVAKFLRHAD